MFTDPKNHGKVVSFIILSILVFSKRATIGYLGFGPATDALFRPLEYDIDIQIFQNF